MSYLTISLDILIVVLARVSVHWTGKPWHLCCSLSSSSPTFSHFWSFSCFHIPITPIFPRHLFFYRLAYEKWSQLCHRFGKNNNISFSNWNPKHYAVELNQASAVWSKVVVRCQVYSLKKKMRVYLCVVVCLMLTEDTRLWNCIQICYFVSKITASSNFNWLGVLWNTPCSTVSIFGPTQWRSPDLCKQPKAIFMSTKCCPVHSPLQIKEALVLSLWNTPLLLHCLPKHFVEK